MHLEERVGGRAGDDDEHITHSDIVWLGLFVALNKFSALWSPKTI